MENFWQEITKLLGILIVFAGALSWLIKSIITHFLSKDTEKYKNLLTKDAEDYKNQLTRDASKEIETLKSQLQITAKESEIRFSKLHEKRIEIISEFYSKLYKADTLVGALELRSKSGDDEITLKNTALKAHESCLDALSFFEKNRLYFSKELSDNVHRILQTMELFSVSYNYPSPLPSNALGIYDEQKKKIFSVMETVGQEFRKMLGSESEKF